MNIEVDLEVNADVALSAFVEVERKGYADNVFAQLAKLYSGEKLFHWAMILTSRQGDHTAGNIDTPEEQEAETETTGNNVQMELACPNAPKEPL